MVSYSNIFFPTCIYFLYHGKPQAVELSEGGEGERIVEAFDPPGEEITWEEAKETKEDGVLG
jgi:hypothetical protein